MYEFTNRFKKNFSIKMCAQDCVEDPTEDNKLRLLAELILRIEDGCEALVPMTIVGETIHYNTISDGFDEWIPMFTDWDELTREELPEFTMSQPIRCILQDAFDHRVAEGIVLNLHTEEVFISKEDLDLVLDYFLQSEAER